MRLRVGEVVSGFEDGRRSDIETGGMHTPVEYSFATPEDLGNLSRYQRFAELVGLDKNNKSGYGFLQCVDEAGNHWTRVTRDVKYLRTLITAGGVGAIADLELPVDKFPLTREGWPDEW